MDYRNVSVATVFVSIMCLSVPSVVPGNGVGLSEQEAIRIANREVERLGKNLVGLEVDIDTTWGEYTRRNPRIMDHYPDAATKLKGRTFWALSYFPKRLTVRGGGLTVFVDKRTGEIIAVIKYE